MGKLSQKNSAQLETSTIFLQFSRANQHFCITTINQSPSYQMFVKKNRNTDVQKAKQVPRTRNMILQSSILFLPDCSTNNALTSKNIQTQMIVNMLQLFLFT